MNDDELITVVRDAFASMHSATPLQHIVHRSRAVRFRRRVPVLAAILAVAAAAGVAIPMLLPVSHQASHLPVGQRLTVAWTATKQADGDVSVTIRQFRDPAGLQRELRADGVPASVIFNEQRSNPCNSYSHSGDLRLLKRAFTLVAVSGRPQEYVIAMVIHPSLLPSDSGVQIIGRQSKVNIRLVEVGHGCTGK